MALKLIKHEIKSTWLEITIVCIAILFFSVMFSFIIKGGLFTNVFASLSIMALGMLYVAAFALIIINVIRSINKKIFSNEGYLTLTLPVSIDQLIIAKVVVNFIWIIVTFLTYFLSFLIIGSTIVGERTIMSIFSVVYEHPLHILLFTIAAALESVVFILTLVLVLSVLNTGTIKKYKLLVGVVFYYLIMNVLSWAKTIIRIIPYILVEGNNGFEIVKTDFSVNNPFGALIVNYVGLDFNGVLFNLIAIVGFYFLSRYIIKTKIELE